MNETWKPVVGYETTYEVSSLGRVKRIVGCQCRQERLRKLILGSGGHLYVVLCQSGKTKNHYIHRLVLEAFDTVRPDGMEARHLDGCPSNNRIDNLAWGTRTQNIADRRIHGVSNIGENNSMAVLRTKQVKEIINLLHLQITKQMRITQKEIANKFGIDFRTVSQIKLGTRWSHM